MVSNWEWTNPQWIRAGSSRSSCRNRSRLSRAGCISGTGGGTQGEPETAGRGGLELQDIVKCALGSLDLGAEHGLPSNVHGNEEIGIGQCSSQAVQPSYGLVGAGEKPQQGVGDPKWGL